MVNTRYHCPAAVQSQTFYDCNRQANGIRDQQVHRSGLGCVGDRFVRVWHHEGADTAQAAATATQSRRTVPSPTRRSNLEHIARQHLSLPDMRQFFHPSIDTQHPIHTRLPGLPASHAE